VLEFLFKLLGLFKLLIDLFLALFGRHLLDLLLYIIGARPGRLHGREWIGSLTTSEFSGARGIHEVLLGGCRDLHL